MDTTGTSRISDLITSRIKRILVCGGRNFPYKFRNEVMNIIDQHVDWYPPDEYGNTLPKCVIISGEARGIDTIALEYAVVNWTGYEGYPAKWELHGKKAGFLRNIEMLDKGKPDLVIAINGGKGTQHTIDGAVKRSIPVHKYKIDLDNPTNVCYTTL